MGRKHFEECIAANMQFRKQFAPGVQTKTEYAEAVPA